MYIRFCTEYGDIHVVLKEEEEEEKKKTNKFTVTKQKNKRKFLPERKAFK